MRTFDGPSIGTRVARYRKMNGWTMDDLAARTSPEIATLSKGVIANIETGRKTDISVTQLVALAAALEVSPVALMVDIEAIGTAHVPINGVRVSGHRMFGWLTAQWHTASTQAGSRDVASKVDALRDLLEAQAQVDMLDSREFSGMLGKIEALEARRERLRTETHSDDAGRQLYEIEIELQAVMTRTASGMSAIQRLNRAGRRLDELGIRMKEANDGSATNSDQ